MRLRTITKRSFGIALVVALLTACDPSRPAAVAPTRTMPADTAPAAEPIEAPAVADRPAPDMLVRALQHRRLSEHDAAAHDFHAIVNSYPNAPEARPARYYLAESFALRERWTSAAEALRAFLADGVGDEYATQALFWLARSHEQAGAWSEAASIYEQYRALNTPLAPYAQMRQAAQQQALGQSEQAADNYAAVATSDIARGEKAGSHEKAAALYHKLGRDDRALELYASLIGFVETSSYRARILSEAAALARATGALDQARSWERELVAQHPENAEALGAVEALLADPAGGLSPGEAAGVYEAHERYADAVPLLDTAIVSTDAQTALDLRRRRALALRGTGDFAAALGELAAVGAADPNGETGRQAQIDWVQTRGQNGETEAAIEGYRQFAQSYPDDPRVPEALHRAALLIERLGDAEGAAQQRMELGRRFGTSEQAQSALESAAWHFASTGRPAEAREAWELLAGGANGSVAARAAYWGARAAGEAGLAESEATLLERAELAAPDSYYGHRAAELRGTLVESSTPLTVTTSAEEWQAAEAWISAWSAGPGNTGGGQGAPQELATEGPVARALALAEVGLFEDAIAEWNEARARWKDEPHKLYAVARLASEHEMPYVGLKAAEDLLALAPADAPPVPPALRRLVFPTPYPEIVVAQANEFGLDPLALYALMRQESLFNPRATSWVGARGLAQVMPETAQGIAANLEMEEFDEADLYQPAVSVRFGAFYLSRQISMMNGSLHGALSAYNGGPGNATRWANGTTVADPDVFVESIDYPETQEYVKLVYGFYGAYKGLYAGK